MTDVLAATDDADESARRRNLRRWGAGVAALLVLLALNRAAVVIPTHAPSGHWESPFQVIALGVMTGMPFGMLAVGLVLIYRTNRIVNFAHGAIGVFGAALVGLAVPDWGLPYWFALIFGVLASAALSAGAEVGVVRRFLNAPRVMSVVATVGVAQFVVTAAFLINPRVATSYIFPTPPGMPVFHIGTLRITQAYSGMLILSPIVVVALTVFLRRSRLGIALQASAMNPEAARLSGINVNRTSSLAWAIAGGLSALSAILTQPTAGVSSVSSFDTGQLLRGLACAAVARMTSIPIALAAGVSLGIVQQLLLWNFAQGGVVELALFLFILVSFTLQRSVPWREEQKGSWAAVLALRPLPAVVAATKFVRGGRAAIIALALVVGLGLPALTSSYTASRLIAVIGFIVIGLAVWLATGLGGQLILGPFAIASVAGAVAALITAHDGNILVAICYAAVAGAAISVVLGLPSLRARGMTLTVTTLAFATMAPAWLLSQSWMLGAGVRPVPPELFGFRFDTATRYYYFAFALMVVAFLVCWNIRRGGLGRVYVAMRDNEANARAFGIPAARSKIALYALAGAVAGLGGVVYTEALSEVSSSAFPTSANLTAVTMTVIGGLSLLSGPMLGALLVVAVPTFVTYGPVAATATSFGLLIILLLRPRGLGSLFEPVREVLIRRFATPSGAGLVAPAQSGVAAAAEDKLPVPGAFTLAPRPREPRATTHTLCVVADSLTKSYGGVQAVRGASLSVQRGEIVGLIGPNGAGKTTMFEMVSGFVRPDGGSVLLDGVDVTETGPEQRAGLGLIRSFQDAALFPTMTVSEVITLAFEQHAPTNLLAAVGLGGRADRRKREGAAEIVSLMGLERYRDSRVLELSTGSRRIVELATLLALRPRVLLLDEPSSGIAQRETEALGELLLRMKGQLDLTLCIIEHDIPLIMGLSDRIVAMADGAVIADGTPEAVRNHPDVLSSYLGAAAGVSLARSEAPRATATVASRREAPVS
jgi:ABC-type branched-subunit amino acid transport system ATPase component/ABC-type branched-subunit amino acid transport system permease subunit